MRNSTLKADIVMKWAFGHGFGGAWNPPAWPDDMDLATALTDLRSIFNLCDFSNFLRIPKSRRPRKFEMRYNRRFSRRLVLPHFAETICFSEPALNLSLLSADAHCGARATDQRTRSVTAWLRVRARSVPRPSGRPCRRRPGGPQPRLLTPTSSRVH